MTLNALQQHDADLLDGCEYLIGIDEAGRGALAGPVVAAACVLGSSFFQSFEAVALSAAVNDSKQLSAVARETYLQQIESLQEAEMLDFAVGAGSVQEIAEYNILGATRLAMQRAVETLAERARSWVLPAAASSGPIFKEDAGVKLIVDGRPLKPFPYVHQGIIKGDCQSLAIAMASIVAKVTRDRLLTKLDSEYPDYGFGGHKGYGTQRHRRAILSCGASPVHRELFLRKILSQQDCFLGFASNS